MCTQKAPYDYSEQLYERYEAAFNQYINAKVLPTLVEKKGRVHAQEFSRTVGESQNYGEMVIEILQLPR